MTQEAMRRIRGGLGAWSDGDLEGALANLRADLEFVTSGVFPGVEPIYHGHEGFRQFWHDFRDTWEQIRVEIRDIVEGEPHRYAVVGNFHAMGRDGIGVERPVGMVFVSTANDEITRIESYAAWEEALDAAGVPPDARGSYR
jgi:ketosteroid isomerase-like protein